MQKKLTITVDETIYNGLHATIGRGNISKFLSDLARPYVTENSLEHAYKEMAADIERETEAIEWVNALIKDISDEAR